MRFMQTQKCGREAEEEEGERQLPSVMLFKQTQQEVGDDLGVCVLNLQIA